jgi:hypothetical protein
MSRTGWLIFVALQAVGEACIWTAGHFLSALGPVLWTSGLFLLLPGDLVGSLIVEKLLWNSRFSILQLNILTVPVELAINAAVWFLCAKFYIYLRKGRVARHAV